MLDDFCQNLSPRFSQKLSIRRLDRSWAAISDKIGLSFQLCLDSRREIYIRGNRIRPKIHTSLTSVAYYFRDPEARNVEVNRRIWHDQWALFSNTMQENCSYWRKMIWHPGEPVDSIARSSSSHAAGRIHGMAGPFHIIR